MTKMKYNTISSSTLTAEEKKSTFTIYADMDLNNKVKLNKIVGLNR